MYASSIARQYLKSYATRLASNVAGSAIASLAVPEVLHQLLFHDDGTDTEYPAYYTEEEWAGHSHLLKDYSLGVGSLRKKRQGRCYDFDGTNDYVDCGTAIGTSLGATNTVSLSMWVKLDAGVNDGLIAISTFSGQSPMLGMYMGLADLIVRAAQVSTAVITYPSFPLNVWKHLVLVSTGTTIALYVDGQLYQEVDYTTTLNFTGLRTTIGAYYSSAFTMDGKARDVRIYNDALSASEVLSLYSDGNDGVDPGKANLLAHYPLQEESGTVTYDIGPNGYHGEILNSQAGFHAVDAGVVKSYPNDEGYSDAYVGTGTSKDSYLILTGAQCVGKTAATIKFKIKTSDTQGAIFGANQDGVAAIGFIQNTAAATWYFSAGTPTATVDGVAIGPNRNDLFNAVVDGQVHEVVFSNVNLDATFDSYGLYFAGYRNAAWYFTGLVWDLEIDGVSYPAPVKPAINTTTAADGSELLYTGRNPNYGLVPSPAWQGDGAVVYIGVGAAPITATGGRISGYFNLQSADARSHVIDARTSSTDGIRIHFNVGVLSLDINTTFFAESAPIELNKWHHFELDRDAGEFRLDGEVIFAFTDSTVTVPSTVVLSGRSFSTPATNCFNGVLGPMSFTVSGVTTTYYPLEGTRDVAYIASDGTGGLIIAAVVNGITDNLYTDGDGSWRNPVIEHGGRYDTNVSSAVLPGRPGTDLSANGLALTIPRNKAPMQLDVNRAGGVANVPGDIGLSIDGLTAEMFDTLLLDSNVNKRLANSQYSDRYGAALTDISSDSFFDNDGSVLGAFTAAPPAPTRVNYTGSVGHQFQMVRDATVIALGRFGGSVFNTSHAIRLYDDAGSFLGGVTVSPSSKEDALGWHYELLSTPIELVAGSIYRIASSESIGGDNWQDGVSASQVVTGSIDAGLLTVLASVFIGSIDTFPNSFTSGGTNRSFGWPQMYFRN